MKIKGGIFMCADNVSQQATQTTRPSGEFDEIIGNAGPTTMLSVFIWLYVVIATIAGIGLLIAAGSNNPGYYAWIGLGVMVQSWFVALLLKVFSRLCDNVSDIRNIFIHQAAERTGQLPVKENPTQVIPESQGETQKTSNPTSTAETPVIQSTTTTQPDLLQARYSSPPKQVYASVREIVEKMGYHNVIFWGDDFGRKDVVEVPLEKSKNLFLRIDIAQDSSISFRLRQSRFWSDKFERELPDSTVNFAREIIKELDKRLERFNQP
jgi:hypothetical protein